MIGSFSFNGIESNDFNLVCKSVKRPLLPSAKVKRVELSNSSGVYDLEDVEYDMREIAMKITYLGKNFQELRSRARIIASWLSTYSWCKLIINDEPDKYYLAKITNDIDLETMFEAGTAEIIFDCQPFALSVEEQIILLDSTGGTFINPGTREINCRSPQGSKFTVSLAGSWTASLNINMNDLFISYKESGNGIINIDTINMEVITNGINKFGVIDGDIDSFFKIVSGSNSILVSGFTGTISIYYIPLWI